MESVRFNASLCCKGLLGGVITVDESMVLYESNKLTVGEELRHIELPFRDIAEVRCSRCALVLPAVSLQNRTGLLFRFVIFGRKRFLSIIESISGIQVTQQHDR